MSDQKPIKAGSGVSPCWAAIESACDPNKTKALLMGEFSTSTPDGLDYFGGITVDWTTIKEIQKAIFEQVKLNSGWSCDGCGSTEHILRIRDAGRRSCCPDRNLVPPNSPIRGTPNEPALDGTDARRGKETP